VAAGGPTFPAEENLPAKAHATATCIPVGLVETRPTLHSRHERRQTCVALGCASRL